MISKRNCMRALYMFGKVKVCSASCNFTRKWTRRYGAHARELIETLYSGIHIDSVQVTLKISTVLKMKHGVTSFRHCCMCFL